jgi:DNA-binding CsgD family transcriptional regulator
MGAPLMTRRELGPEPAMDLERAREALDVLDELDALDEPPPPPATPMPACTPTTRRRRQAEALERQHAPMAAPTFPLAAEVMRGVMAGEWVITDHFQGEGRRFLIVQRCRAGDGRALSEREREVLALALQGHSNKFVAYELGLTSSTVATHLRRAMAKLRVESREALIQALTIDTSEEVAATGADETAARSATAAQQAASAGRNGSATRAAR